MDILLTGANGFLGKIIQDTLKHHQIITLGRKDATIISDLLQKESINLPQVELVVHAAGKAHIVPKTTQEKQAFFDVNVKGTQNLLMALEGKLPRHFVFISSVAVYGKESGENIHEDSPLLAEDAYGKSKIAAEQIVSDWCRLNNVTCTILRLPLLVGPNAPGNLGAMVNGIKTGLYANIGGGKTKKSMVLAEDVAAIIPYAASIGGIYNLTDGYHPSFYDLSKTIAEKNGISKVKNIPKWIIMPVAIIGDVVGSKFPINSNKIKKILSTLIFDDEKARKQLNWQPSSVLTKLSKI